MNIDMNLLLRIAVFLLIFAFLLFVVQRLTRSPGLEVNENGINMIMSSLSLAGFILGNRGTKKTDKKGISMPTSIMVWAVIILVVVGLSLLIWAAVTGSLGSALSWVWSKVWPF